MNGPILTEERLRHYLDSNQAMRERLCLAIMPLLGPYTREQPRRPKGGPDGGRDIEAVFQGSMTIWGAVGFRNGGGNDDTARNEAERKYYSDLDRALAENPSLQGFVFFTNVDLTPGIVTRMKERASNRGLAVVDICDMERMRHTLDSPEGLIPRLQYLDIPMSATEQIALVNKFGTQLQNAVLARFDRVEKTLSQMERYLGFQKPIHRLDLYVSMKAPRSSHEIGSEALLVKIDGLQNLGKSTFCLCLNLTSHSAAHSQLVSLSHLWLSEKPEEVISFPPSLGLSKRIMAAYYELSLTTGGHRVRIADLTIVNLTVHITAGLLGMVDRILVDANGYELFNCQANGVNEVAAIETPNSIAFDPKEKKWIEAVPTANRNLIFAPPNPSVRYLPLRA